MEKPNTTAQQRDAALARLKKAQADVAGKLMPGRPQAPEEKQALKAATEELKAATEEVQRLGIELPQADFDALNADLDERVGKK